MQRIFLAVIAVLMSIMVNGQTIEECQAGQLASRVDDCSITSLEVSGHIDARDFRFIADSLRHLKALDLSQAIIDPFHGEALFANVSEYAEAEVPCLSLASMLELESMSLPTTAQRLGDGCLSGCAKLTQLVLPTHLAHIGDYAFSGCPLLQSVEVPQSLSYIGDGAFSNCAALTEVVPARPDDSGQEVVSPAVLHIGYRAFAMCPSLKSLNLGTQWSEVGAETFAESGLEALDLSKQTSLTELPDWSLLNTELHGLSLPETLNTMGAGALMNVSGITHLTLPKAVSYIDSHAMAYMTGLVELESKPTTVPALGDSVWYGVDQHAVKLNVDAQSLMDYRNAAQWCNFLLAEIKRGDVNADGVVDITDVNILINIMLGRDSADKYDGRAYVTQDSVIDIADVNSVINLMLARLRALHMLDTLYN